MCKSSCFTLFAVSYHVKQCKVELAFPPIVVYTVNKVFVKTPAKSLRSVKMMNINGLVKSLFLNDLMLG